MSVPAALAADLPQRTRSELRKARVALLLEHFWPLLAGMGLVGLGFLTAGAFGVWERAGALIHLILWLGLVAAALVGFRSALRSRPDVGPEALARRLERDSGAEDRPLLAWNDHPASGDAGALEFWRLHRTRLFRRLAVLRAGPAVLRGTRFAGAGLGGLAIGIIAAFVLSGTDVVSTRLLRSLFPDFGALWDAQNMGIEAWASPPAYSGRAPVFLAKSRNGPAIAIPEGTTLLVRARGRARPVLVMTGDGKRQTIRFEVKSRVKGKRVYEAKTTIAASVRVSVRFLGERAAWRFEAGEDAPPSVEFDTPPARLGPNNSLLVKWKAGDDFGVTATFLEIESLDAPDKGPWKNAERWPLSEAAGGVKSLAGESRLDLIRSRFAGKESKLRLLARDAIGQEGVSAVIRHRVPEKSFSDPVALALLEIRSEILGAPDDWPKFAQKAPFSAAEIRRLPDFWSEDQRPGLSRAPKEVRRAARMLDAISLVPEDLFIGYAPYLGLRYARARLETARNRADTILPAELLWEVAAAIEGDGRTEAEQALAQAKAALERALANGASPEEIEQRLADLREATRRFLEERAAEALARGGDPQETANSTRIDGQDLEELIRELEDLAKNGDPEEARKALETLAEVLQNLQFNANPSPGDGQPGQSGQAGRDQKRDEAQDALADALGRQRALNDETFKRQQDGQSGTNLSGRQRQLAEELGRAQGALPRNEGDRKNGAPRPGAADGRAAREALGRAREAMEDSARALDNDNSEEALQAQQQALRELRAASQALARQDLAERLGKDAVERDPLGRRLGGNRVEDGEKGYVPGASERKRVREILDEIRRRAGQANRPREEQDYLKRLLDQF